VATFLKSTVTILSPHLELFGELDLEDRVIYVQNMWRNHIQTVKSRRRNRRLPILAELVEHLRTYVQSWRPNHLGLLFATSNCMPWDHISVHKRKFHPLLRKLGIRQCGFHAFRHGNATLRDRLGTPMAVRQNRLGHADAQTTMRVHAHCYGRRSHHGRQTWENFCTFLRVTNKKTGQL